MQTYIITSLSEATAVGDGDAKRYRKMLACFGEVQNPSGNGKLVLDKAWAERIVENATNGPIKLGDIPVPLGHPSTSAELARDNKGWLVDLDIGTDGLYGVYEISDTDTAEAIDKKLIKDVSVAFDTEYTDKKTGKKLRDVLMHVGLVNDPYLKGMTPAVALSDGYRGIVMCSTDGNGELINEKEMSMQTITNDKDFDVTVSYQENGETVTKTIKPGESIEVPADQFEAVKATIEKLAEQAVIEKEKQALADREKALADREKALAEKESKDAIALAESSYKKLLDEGRIVPAQKDAFIALATHTSTKIELSDHSQKPVSDLFTEFMQLGPKKIELNDEKGVNGPDGSDVELTDSEKSLIDFGVSEDDLKETKKLEGEK